MHQKSHVAFHEMSTLTLVLWLAGTYDCLNLVAVAALEAAMGDVDMDVEFLMHGIPDGHPLPAVDERQAGLTRWSSYNNPLSGTIAPGWSALTSLERWDLSSNRLSGFVPTQLGALGLLRSLRRVGLRSCCGGGGQ